MKNLINYIDNIIKEQLSKNNIADRILINLKHNKVRVSVELKFNNQTKHGDIIPMFCDLKFNDKQFKDINCEYNSKDNTLYFNQKFELIDIYNKISKFDKLKLTNIDKINILSKF